MATHLLIERADGGVSVMAPVPGADPVAELARWQDAADPAWLPVARTIPADNPVLPPRRWRAAWRRVGSAVGVPLAEARKLRKKELLAVALERLPRVRDKIEAAEDAGNLVTMTQLKQRRSALRAMDVDAELAALTTLTQIDSYIPAILQTAD